MASYSIPENYKCKKLHGYWYDQWSWAALLWRAVDLAKEKGSILFIDLSDCSNSVEHGFVLHKGAFHNTLSPQARWTPSKMPHAPVETNFQWNMLYFVPGVDSIQSGTTKFITWEPIFLQRPTVTWILNWNYVQPVWNEIVVDGLANLQDGAWLDVATNRFWSEVFGKNLLWCYGIDLL